MPVIVDIPKKKALPEEKKVDAVTRAKNFAGNEKTCEELTKRAKAFLERFRSQAARDAEEDRMDEADEMFRLSADQSKQDQNKTQDEIDIRPGHYHRTIEAITANENSVLYGTNEELPVRYVPLSYADEVQTMEAQSKADAQNLVLEYSMVKDKRRRKLRRTQLFLNKYGNRLVGMDWHYREREDEERQPTAYDEEGQPTEWAWKKTKRIEEHPIWLDFDIADAWFDAAIDDMQAQQCILLRDYPVYSELVAEQKVGKYVNVGDVTKEQLYQQETPSRAKGDRHANAGEGSDQDMVTGRFERWRVFIMAPINDEGEIDVDGTISRRCIATFLGNMESGKTVCVQVVHNIYDTGDEIPLTLIHSHEDDKGAFHLGFPDIIGPSYTELKTSLDQWFENKALVNNAPWMEETGTLVSTDWSFKPRRLVQVRPGGLDRVKRIEVKSNTADSLQFLGYQETRIKEDTHTTKPFLGEAMGARTSASEARNAMEQAMKPSAEKLTYMEDQILIFMAEWDKRLWRRFARGKTVITIARGADVEEIRPAQLYGELMVQPVATTKYIQDSISRLETDKFLQIWLPALPNVLSKGEMKELARGLAVQRKVLPPEVIAKVFGVQRDKDALHVARSEDQGFMAGIPDLPKEGEMHDVHLAEHDNFLSLLKTFPDRNEVEDRAMELAEVHIEQHRQMEQNEKAALSTALQPEQEGQAQAEQPTGLPSAENPIETGGQEAQSLLGAEGGAMA